MMSTALQKKVHAFFASHQNEARRVFHGRGHCYPGLEHITIDWYRPVVLISTYKAIEAPESLAETILKADRHSQVKSIILQSRHIAESPAQILWGDHLHEVVVKAQGLRFEVHPGKQQNAGLFLDVGPLREWLIQHADNRNVLNLFAYTCSLSVAALAGGATRVTNVDISKTSIAWGEKNHALNNQDKRKFFSIPHNIFKSWGRIRQYGRYDLVIIDPPTRQRGSFETNRDYPSIVKRLPKLCNPGCLVVAALNSPFHDRDYLLGVFRKMAPECSFLGFLPVDESFEEKDPQKGLKIYSFKFNPGQVN